MYYTLAQVREALIGSTGRELNDGAYTSSNLNRDIDRAVRGLVGLSGWECMRRTVRFFSAGPVFALPQGYAGLTRVCVNGRPAALRGQDFRFLQAGPGDLRHPPAGFEPIPTRNVKDIGMSPVILEPIQPFKMLAFVDVPDSEVEAESSPEEAVSPALVVKGIRPDGRLVTVRLDLNPFPDDGDIGSAEYDIPDVSLVRIENVAIDGDAPGYITLYAVDEADETNRYQIACYHPKVTIPMFRRYTIDGIPPGAPVEILAETRIDPLPLTEDTDVIPFQDPVEPIEWMIRADWAMKSGEQVQA